MLFVQLLVALLVVLVAVQALHEIPERARGGEFYKELVKSSGLKSKTQLAKTWNAPVDHFDKNSQTTFAQRYFSLRKFV